MATLFSKKMYKSLELSAISLIASVFLNHSVYAKESFAIDLDVYPDCSGCHTSGNVYSSDSVMKRNLKPEAATAYNKRGLTGLRAFLASLSPATPTLTCTAPQVLNTAKTACETPQPVVPTCTAPQVLNTAKTACETPQPVVPTCTAPQVLNAAKTACETPQPVVPTCTAPQVLNVAKTACETPAMPLLNQKNTKPVLNAVSTQWDARVGQLMRIPLTVYDAQQDDFKLTGEKNGAKFSSVYISPQTLLPTVDFEWTPTKTQAGKTFNFSFIAKETTTKTFYTSNQVNVSINVWQGTEQTNTLISRFNVGVVAWRAGQLFLQGNLVFDESMNSSERDTFFLQEYEINLANAKKTNEILESHPLIIDKNGDWYLTIPMDATQVPCKLRMIYQGLQSLRTVSGAPVSCL
jgi:hypothetical protein